MNVTPEDLETAADVLDNIPGSGPSEGWTSVELRDEAAKLREDREADAERLRQFRDWVTAKLEEVAPNGWNTAWLAQQIDAEWKIERRCQ